MKLDLTKKELKIDISRVLKNNKRVDFKSMPEEDKLKYILSHFGYKQRGLDVPKVFNKNLPIKDHFNHKLTNRTKNYFSDLQRNLFKVGPQIPLENVQYYGVEIECLIPYESLNIDKDDYSSGGSGYRECSSCEGLGKITCTHRNSGHEIETECPDCGGTGEIEDDSSDEDNGDLFYACKSKLVNLIKDSKIKGVDVKEDGSIEDNDTLWGVELTVLVRQDDMSNLESLCKLLNSLNTEVNSSCGLHVHIDARQLTRNKVLKIGDKFSKVLPFLSTMVPNSRRKNRFCKLSVSSMEEDSCRYHAVNLTAFEKYQTIEVRLHSSTTSFTKISNWIKILSLVYHGEMSEVRINAVSTFCKHYQVDETLKSYIVSRVNKFSELAEETTCEAEADDVSQTEMVA